MGDNGSDGAGLADNAGDNPPDWDEVGRRLRHLRRALFDESGPVFARRLGVSYERWNNYERGLPLSRDVAIRLCERIPGMSLDYLFFGTMNGLSGRIIEQLRDSSASPSKSSRAKRPS